LNDGDEKKVLGEDEVVTRVRSILTRTKETPVLVKADTNVPYGRVVTGMVLLQEAGAEKVGFITDPAEARNNKKR
jgi:biopolymer transport protein TolR